MYIQNKKSNNYYACCIDIRRSTEYNNIKAKGEIIMSPVSTNIKIDPELKRQAQALFNEMGMTLTTAINIFLKQAVRENAIPFKVGLNVPNEETLAAIAEGEELLKNPSLGKSYNDVDEMMKELLA